MGERMSRAEIERRYPDHWIFLGDVATDAELEVTSGVVLAADPDRDAVDRRALELRPGGRVAFLCTQPTPAGEVFVL